MQKVGSPAKPADRKAAPKGTATIAAGDPAGGKGAAPEAKPGGTKSAGGSGFLNGLATLAASARAAGRTADDVRRDADSLFYKAGSHFEKAGDRTLERDPVSSNRSTDVAKTEAPKQVELNADAVQAYLTGLNAADRAAYDRIRAQVSNRPLSELALQVLLLEGKLTGAGKSAGSTTLLAELGRLADEKTALAAKIDRNEITGWVRAGK